MKRISLLLTLILAISLTNPLAAESYDTEYDINFKNSNSLLHLRAGMGPHDWHGEFYTDLFDVGGGTVEYGIIYQDREVQNLTWHQINWKSPKLTYADNRVKFWITAKLNYVPSDTVMGHGAENQEGFGFHNRFWNQIVIADGLRLTTFVEPRWQQLSDGFGFLGSKSRMTLDKDIGKTTLHVGMLTYGNATSKFDAKTEYVVMYTFKF
jgi:hypothetical protein